MVLKKQAQGSMRSVPRGSVEPSPKVGRLNLGEKDGESQRRRPLSWILKVLGRPGKKGSSRTSLLPLPSSASQHCRGESTRGQEVYSSCAYGGGGVGGGGVRGHSRKEVWGGTWDLEFILHPGSHG